MDHETALIPRPTPEVPTGFVRVGAADLVRLLNRLTPFAGTSGVTVRHVWLQTFDRQLVGQAFDLTAGAQCVTRAHGQSRLPLIGITSKEVSKLTPTLGKITGQVDLALTSSTKRDAPPGSVQLAARESGVDTELARADLYLPTSTDEGWLVQLEAELVKAHELTADSNLPFGYGELNLTTLGRFKTGRTGQAQVWFGPNGRAFIHVDNTFWGFHKAVRAGHGRATRPAPPAPLSTFSTGKVA